jgi:hypothetical protein
MIRYLFENKNEEWLTKSGELTKDPIKAMKSKCEVEATLFLFARHKEGKYEEFNVTEHDFVD